MRINQQSLSRIGVKNTRKETPSNVNHQGQSFKQILDAQQKRSEPLKFSKHAVMRLKQKDIQLTKAQMTKLTEGIEQADQKGINESLVLMDDVALVVNVKNKTIVTAMDKTNSAQIFTNIDGAVLL